MYRFELNLDEGTHSTTFETKYGRYNIGVTTKIGDTLLSISPRLSFKINDDLNFAANMSVSKSKEDYTSSMNLGFTHNFSRSLNAGVYFNANIKNYDIAFTCLTLNTNVGGYSFKIPFFLGTKKTKGAMLLTAGIALVANLIALMTIKKYKKRIRNKRFTTLDVDFRKFEEKYEEIKDFERNEIPQLVADPDLEIIDAYIGNKKHVELIAYQLKNLYDPPKTPQEYDRCQVVSHF